MRTILFLDIDGVLSIPNIKNTDERKERWPGFGIVWPIPMAYPLLRTIDKDKNLYPVWMTAWDTGAWTWNERAGTEYWPIAYHLSKRRQTWALRRFPAYQEKHIDGKLLAVRWFLRHYPHNPVVWIEDGFAQETEDWAIAEKRVRLVNTWPMECRVATFLMEDHSDKEKAVQDFINHCCFGGVL